MLEEQQAEARAAKQRIEDKYITLMEAQQQAHREQVATLEQQLAEVMQVATLEQQLAEVMQTTQGVGADEQVWNNMWWWCVSVL